MAAGFQLRAMVLLLVAGASPSGAQTTEQKLENLAPQFEYFCANIFLYDQPGCWTFKPDDYQQLAAEFASVEAPTDEFVRLLEHPNPRVRTLAIAKAFAKEDPTVLPALAARIGDAAATFPQALPDARPLLPARDWKPILRDQTVGDIAQQAVRFYLERAGFYGKIGGPEGFEAYWKSHGNRSYSASWFMVQLARASQSTNPTPADRRGRILEVRRRMDAVPSPDRGWTLLWLNGEPGSDILVSESELIEAARSLGSERLMEMLGGKIESTDPDLQPGNRNNYPYIRMGRFVLERAGQLLRPVDSAHLLELAKGPQETGFDSSALNAWFFIAAAQLHPEEAPEILPGALERFEGPYHGEQRADLAAAIWRLVGSPRTESLIDWLYRETPERGRLPHARAQFLRSVSQWKGADPRGLLKGIITDPRFEDLDWQSLRELSQDANVLAGTDIVPAADLEKAWHPLGEGHFHWQRAEASAKYPKETRALLDVLKR